MLEEQRKPDQDHFIFPKRLSLPLILSPPAKVTFLKGLGMQRISSLVVSHAAFLRIRKDPLHIRKEIPKLLR